MTIKRLRLYYKNLIVGNRSRIAPTNVAKSLQQAFAKALGKVEDDFSRSYAKYQCRKYLSFGSSRWLNIVMNTLSGLVLIPIFLYYCILSLIPTAKRSRPIDSVILKSSLFGDVSDIVPEEADNHSIYVSSKQYTKGRLNFFALSIFLKCWSKHPFSFYYLVVVLTCLAEYTRVIRTFRPQRIYTFADEKHFAKPLATLLCEHYGIMHIGFMHGELYYQIDKGFFRYSVYYVWDKHYLDIFDEMRCSADFRVYMPKRLTTIKYEKKDAYGIYMTYFESGNNEESLIALSTVFRRMEDKGKRCLLRTHPRSSDMAVVNRYFREDQLQNAKEISVHDAIAKSQYVAALCSTVLMEALYGGKEIVIDDISDKKTYSSLIEKGYIIFSKNHRLLSQVMNQ